MKYPLCTLGSILNPGKYCVVSTDKEHVAEVKNLEENLWEEMCYGGTSEFPLHCQMCVAVRDSENKFRRGVIEKKLTGDLYEVLLVDYGKVVEVNKSNIKIITNKDFTRVEPLSFIVKLYGLIPAKYVVVGGVRKPKAFTDWDPECHAFIQDIFKDNLTVVVCSILIQKRTVYGDVFVKLNSKKKFTSLRKLLCKNEFCVYSENNFLKKEGLDPSKECVELETKMEFVEKWQRENFGEVQKFTYELPPPVLSPGTSAGDITLSNFSSSNSIRELSKQTEKMSDNSENNCKESVEKPKRLGMGRGKIKLMLAEVKSKEMASLGGDDGAFLQKDSPKKIEPSAKVSFGRGKLLKKYFEMNKSLGIKMEAPQTTNSNNGKENIFDPSFAVEKPSGKNGRMEEGRRPEFLSNVEKAVIKSGEFSEFSDSNELTEVSLSTEDGPPPLVRNLTKDKNQERTEWDKNQEGPRTDFVKSDLNIKQTSKRSETSGDGRFLEAGDTGSHRHERQDQLESWPCEADIVSKVPSKSIKLYSCWTPYVLFEDCVVEPVNTFRDLPIQPSIIKNLEKGGSFSDLSQVQRWAIPAIRKQHNTILIGSSKTGKTLSYIVPLMDYIQDESYFEELPEGNGPYVVIVASSAQICESIYYMCHSLLGHFTQREVLKSKIKILIAHGSGCEEEIWVNLTNGCHVLISTPHCLVRLLEMPVLTNFERLTCLVLDEVDVISQYPFRKSVRIILEKARLSTKDRHYQKIICGEKWTPKVENLVEHYVKTYALVICSYSEAIIYEGLKPSVCLVDQKKKPEILLGKMKDIRQTKILIVCEDLSEACCLSDFLNEKKIEALLAHEKILADKLREIRTHWLSSRDSVLIATDGVLNELGIREAQTLIHYGLPKKSKTNFYLRYSTLENFLLDKQNFLKNQAKKCNTRLHNIVIVDDENHCQLPHIIDFVLRLGGKVSPKVLRKCEEIRRVIEIEKWNRSFCKNLLAFGRCRKSKDCPQRHALVKEWDSPRDLPTSGWVNFVVVKTHDASWFSARLVKHDDEQGTISELVDYCLELSAELLDYFKCEKNQRPLGTPNFGDICAVKTGVLNQNVFYRAKIIEYLKVDRYEKPLEVKVKLMDLGEVWTRKCTELYELPENLSKYPPTAVDIRLVGVQPLDFDVSWAQKTNDFVEGLLNQKLEENQFWSGKVVLALNNTLFLNPVKRKHYLSQLKTQVFDLVLQNELLNKRIAVLNNQHLPSLMKLCAEAGIEVTEKEVETKKGLVKIEPQWAFFDSDFIQVRFLAAESTSTVFLQLKKFEELLQDLEEDCQKEGEKAAKETKTGKEMTMAHPVTVGMFCLALFEDGKWNRGRVESENETEFFIFFVDHGDFLLVAKSNVVPIPEPLLLRLPCQAIECRLIGIKSEEGSSMEVLQEIYSFSEDGEEDLYAFVRGEVLQPNVTKGRKYNLNLLNKKGVSLNKMLVDRGLVRADESEKDSLEDIETGQLAEEEKHESDRENDGEEACQGVADTSLDDTFLGFCDDVFEDDNALEFLKEFASKVFPVSGASQDNCSSAEGCQGTESISNSSTVVQECSPEQMIARQNLKLLRLNKKRQSRRRRELELKSREDVLTPQVLWCQNQLEIQMKIQLGNVVDYSSECTIKNFSFRCILGEKFYAVDLKLYGAVNPQMMKVSAKAFHVLVVLTKLAFPLWPRLHEDEGKHRWISLDVESLTDKDGAFSERIRLAKMEIASGNVKEGIRDDNILPYSDSEDSCERKLDYDSESSQDYE